MRRPKDDESAAQAQQVQKRSGDPSLKRQMLEVHPDPIQEVQVSETEYAKQRQLELMKEFQTFRNNLTSVAERYFKKKAKKNPQEKDSYEVLDPFKKLGKLGQAQVQQLGGIIFALDRNISENDFKNWHKHCGNIVKLLKPLLSELVNPETSTLYDLILQNVEGHLGFLVQFSLETTRDFLSNDVARQINKRAVDSLRDQQEVLAAKNKELDHLNHTLNETCVRLQAELTQNQSAFIRGQTSFFSRIPERKGPNQSTSDQTKLKWLVNSIRLDLIGILLEFKSAIPANLAFADGIIKAIVTHFLTKKSMRQILDELRPEGYEQLSLVSELIQYIKTSAVEQVDAFSTTVVERMKTTNEPTTASEVARTVYQLFKEGASLFRSDPSFAKHHKNLAADYQSRSKPEGLNAGPG